MKVTHALVNCAVSASILFIAPDTLYAQQDYPSKPIRIVVGVAPGGATDILARVIGTKMSENLRQQVIVENRPGANHVIGGQFTHKCAPDGYTMQVVPDGWVINASMHAKLPFDPVRDFTPIAMLALVPTS
jgi:tripartite-type tricarboxylate transporter receptor subunit TctC